MRHARKRNPRGSTLIEVMVALTILAIGFLGVFQASILASNQNAIARRQSAGSTLGTDIVEAVERLPYAHPAFATSGGTGTTTLYDRASNVLTFDWEDEQPLLGAMPVVVKTDQDANAMGGMETIELQITDDADESGNVLAKQIVILVRIRVAGAGAKDLRLFTAKYNPQRVIGGTAAGFTEI